MPFDQGIDFRSTAAFVTDPSGCDNEIGTTANYPRTSAQGNTVGWEDAPAGTRNRTSSVDARLAGIAFVSNGASPKRYRFDLPSSGWYRITLALGDNTTGQSLSCEVFDGTTLVSTVIRQNIAVAAGTFFDACGVRRSSAADWVTNEVSFVAFFATTICRIRLGNGGASGNSPIAHARVTAASTPNDPLPAGVDFRLSSQFVTDPAGNSPDINTVADYPHITAQGLTVGWEQAASGTADRSSGVDARLAGEHSVGNVGVSKFRIDLPSIGDYIVALAMGDNTTAQTQTAELFDGTTSLGAVVSGGSTTAGQFYDASGVKRTSAADWVSNEVEVTKSFATTILRVAVGANGATSGNSTIAHVHVKKAPIAVTITGVGHLIATLLGTKVFGPTLAGVGHLTAAVKRRLHITPTLAGHGTLTATVSGLKRFTATVTGHGTMTATVAGLQRITATITGHSSVSATVAGLKRFTASITGRGTLAATVSTGGVTRAVTATITGKGSLRAQFVQEVASGALELRMDGPTVTLVQPDSGALSLRMDAPTSGATSSPETAQRQLRMDVPTLATETPTGRRKLHAGVPILPARMSTARRVLRMSVPRIASREPSGKLVLRVGVPTLAGPVKPTSGRLSLRMGVPSLLGPAEPPTGIRQLKMDPPDFGEDANRIHCSGIRLLKMDVPILPALKPPPVEAGSGAHLQVTV